MQLQNLQAELAEAILDKDETISIAFPNHHLSIYRHNYIHNLTSAMKETYSLIVKLVGDDFFNQLVIDYSQQYPSRDSNLYQYGEFLDIFLSSYRATKELIYLPEVARFEWLCHHLFFAPDHEKMDLENLKTISSDDYEELNFQLHPASDITQCRYPILKIIELCRNGTNEEINLKEGGAYLLMIRRENEISLQSLTIAEYHFLSALKNNLTIAQALRTALYHDAYFDLEKKLPTWIKSNIIVSFNCQ